LPLHDAQYKEWTAKRRIISYGGSYDFVHNKLLTAEPLPAWLYKLRSAVAEWSGEPAGDFNHAIIAEYQPGTQLGWHRDVPNFETIVGISLAGSARLRLRPYPHTRNSRSGLALELRPRSIYALRGAVRWDWQHAISPTKCMRYSITFRTLRE
jgi:alkylated DNA repair dioxygenase AlkB